MKRVAAPLLHMSCCYPASRLRLPESTGRGEQELDLVFVWEIYISEQRGFSIPSESVLIASDFPINMLLIACAFSRTSRLVFIFRDFWDA